MSDNDIVGHKTIDTGETRDGMPVLRHEPLTRGEADRIMASIEAAKAKRTEAMPDAEAAASTLWDAWYRLKELGWKDPRYAPADGRIKKIIEIGSSGLHDAHCVPRDDERGGNWWWIPEGGYCPTTPVLYLPDEQEKADDDARGARMREAFKRIQDETVHPKYSVKP